MGIQINGSTDRITAIDGTIDFVSNIGNIGLITASRYELLDSITIGAGSTIIKTVNGKLGIGIASPDYELDVTGSIGFTSQIRGASGSASAPSYSYDGDSDSGMFRGGVNILSFATTGTERLRIASTGQVLIGETSTSGMSAYDLGMKNNTAIRFRKADGSAWINTVGLDNSNNLKLGWGGSVDEIHFGISGIGEQARFDSGGRLLIGTTSHQEAYGTSALQIAGTSGATSSMSLIRHGNSPYLVLGSSGGSSLGAVTALSSGDRIGQITFAGADGTDINTHAASIAAYVDGSVSSNNVPTRIVFATGPSETERLRITSGGNILIDTTVTTEATADASDIIIGTTSDTQKGISIVGSTSGGIGNLYFTDGAGYKNQGRLSYHHADDSMRFTTASNERFRIDHNGHLLIGTTSLTGISAGSDDIVIGSIGDSTVRGITFATTDSAAIRWADAGDNAMGRVAYSNSTDVMTFHTSNATRLRLDSDGMKFGSDSAAANALSDYEEGTVTFAPVNSGVSFSSSYKGRYTKIGELVTVSGYIVVASLTQSGATLNVQLPFTSATNGQGYYTRGVGATFSKFMNFPSNYHNMIAYVGGGENYIRFFMTRNTGGSADWHQMTHNNITSNSAIYFNVCYTTTS